MKLVIRRDQQAQKGVFGGHKGMTFLLSARVELNSGEQELVARYKAENHPLTFVTHEGMQIAKDTVADLMKGTSEEVSDITILLDNEEVIRDACRNFKALLDVMETFGGEEVIEFD